MAYAIMPLLILLTIFINEKKKNVLEYSLIFGLLISLQIMFDLRITYVLLTGVFLFWIINMVKDIQKKIYFKHSLKYLIFIPGLLTGILNLYWILPTFTTRQSPMDLVGSAYTSLEAVKFYSFSKLEGSISLLHPNWPENIFGKIGFMRPEFLIIPILAFTSLFFIKGLKESKEKTYLIFFAVLGVIGAFLAKGANEPFGDIYLWLFNHFPGFIMFRDPTKWYMLIAVSYSMLIPYSLWRIQQYLSLKFKKVKYLPHAFLVIVFVYLLFLIRPVLLGQLSGTFKSTSIPLDYINLENYIFSDSNFSRTLWIPTIQRFGYYSNLHPAIPAQYFLNTVDFTQISKKLNTLEGEKLLQEAGVRYVIVPIDSQGEIFLKDRKFNDELYKKTVGEVNRIGYLKKINGFGEINVFEIPNTKDHFWTNAKNLLINYKFISPVEYEVNLKNAKKGDVLVFSESYDSGWIAQDSNIKIISLKFDNRFNSFVLSKDGNYTLKVYYASQEYVNIGMGVSLTTLILTIGLLIYLLRKKK
jgi:hypothetical protein